MRREIRIKFPPITGKELREQMAEARARRAALLDDPEVLQALRLFQAKGLDSSDVFAVYNDMLTDKDAPQ
jgi:hypothetical protein